MRLTLEVAISMTDEQVEQYQGRFGLIGLDPTAARDELRTDITTAVQDVLQHYCKESEFWTVTVTRSGSTKGAAA